MTTKIGIVGAGKRYLNFYKDVLKSFDVEIVGFVTNSGKLSSSVGDYRCFKTMHDLCEFDQPDFFISIVPYYVTPHIINSSCDLKTDILVETPIGNFSDAHTVIDKIRDSKILVGVAEQWAFLPLECFKKKMIDMGLLGEIYVAENDYRSYNYHGMAQLRNYLGKDSNVSQIIGSFQQNYPLDDKSDIWNVVIAKMDNGKTLIYKYTDLYKRVDVRNFKSIRVYGSKGSIISDCYIDRGDEKFSIIWNNGETYHLNVEKEFFDIDGFSTIKTIKTNLPDNTTFEWKNNFFESPFNEDQIAIAHHIRGMIDEDVLWSAEDGFKDLQLLT